VTPTRCAARQRGFTLAEIAIVFLIVALLIGGTVLTVSAQNDAREIADTQRTLEQAREAIIGFALRNGRLPCPAQGGGVAVETFCVEAIGPACTPTQAVQVHGRCFRNPGNLPAGIGFVPAATLGIGPVETSAASANFGLLLDSWLQPVRYVVSDVPAPPPSAANRKLFTAAGEMRNHLLTPPPATTPDLLVCTTSAGAVPATPACGAGVPGFQTPAVVFSTGKMQATLGPVGVDEVANVNNDRVFVSRPPTTPINPALPAPNPGFDDLVLWVSPNILYNRLIAAGAI
jgi:type II secretory pathway pseudopilin PulG